FWQVPVQMLPHSPQLFASVARSMHDPSQSESPLEQGPGSPMHEPSTHVPPHALPHSPQFALSVLVSAHASPHLFAPAGHATHVASAPAPRPAVPRAPAGRGRRGEPARREREEKAPRESARRGPLRPVPRRRAPLPFGPLVHRSSPAIGPRASHETGASGSTR